jgi:hypothetical protein
MAAMIGPAAPPAGDLPGAPAKGGAGAPARESPAPVLAEDLLLPGVVLLDGGGAPRAADPRALGLLGCRDAAGLADRWPHLLHSLEAAGLDLPPAGDPKAVVVPKTAPRAKKGMAPAGTIGMAPAGTFEIELASPPGGARRLRVSLLTAGDGEGGDGGAAAVLLIQDAELGAALDSDVRAASQMRSLAEITPAVAHDLRAPINAMVLNLEVLKQTLTNFTAPTAPTAAMPPGTPGRSPRERQQRYVHVLGEELARLHKALEIFLAHVAPRGERCETLDLREAVHDLAALLRPHARKQQSQIEVLAPDQDVPVAAQRYLLRQALLHTGLAVLGQVPREGTLEIRLDRPAGQARLRIVATSLLPAPANGGDMPAMPAAAAAAGVQAAGLGPTFSQAGTEARLAVARSILALFGGTLREAPSERTEPCALPRVIRAFEIHFPLSPSN